jgi:decarbamoylnovobiocin carbamoyltransferase/7-O-carbamoyltransferase
MLVLGLSGNFSDEDVDLVPNMSEGFAHDAAACLIKDGELVAAVEEERFNRIKKTTKFPINAVRACLEVANVLPSEVDAVGHYFQEAHMDRVLNSSYVRETTVPTRYSRELITSHLADDLGIEVPAERLIYAAHHIAHARSCFVRSGMDDALVLVMDTQGERDSTTVYRGSQGQLECLATHQAGKSLGTFYALGTRLLGYGQGDEYKVMGLAPYGNPETYRPIFESIYNLKDNGDFDLYPGLPGVFFNHGFLPRRKGREFTQQDKDFAAGLQNTLEKIVLHILKHWAEATGLSKLCFVGGVAHNSTLNGLVLRSGEFREVFIHPASHDAGAAEGAALTAACELGAPPFRQSRLRSASLGPGLGTATSVEKELAAWGDLVEYERPANIVECAAELLASGSVLGWAQGRSEFGPRALGNRSILADARPSENKQKVNSMVKKRESFRPFAPVVTVEAAGEYFNIPETCANYEFMSFVVDVRQDRRVELGAVTHVDGSARLQIIDSASNPRFHRLVQRFGELTGTPVLLNTSFNNNVEPIVQTVYDALTCFLTTGLDFLVIEDFLVRKRHSRPLAFDGFIIQFRLVARLAKRSWVTRVGTRCTTHEIYLDYTGGARAEVSPATFTLLEEAAGDSTRTVKSLAEVVGGLTEDIRSELYSLWERRFIVLRPGAGDPRESHY